jgi:uncharacterized protein (DUF58 family)
MLAKEILLRAKKQVWTNKSSNSLSKIRGEGLDFCEIRPYQPGDDVRHINFTASAKGQELQTNVFNEDKQISVVIAVLLSSSLQFGSQTLKIETLAEIVAILGLSSIKQHNKTQLVLFEKKSIFFDLHNEAILLDALEFILNFDLAKITFDFKKANDFLATCPKSLVFLLGDFYTQYNYALTRKKHQLNALIVRDKLEENPNFLSQLDLVDFSTNHKIGVDFNAKISEKYQTKIQAIDKSISQYFAKNTIKSGKIYTHDSVFLTLNQLLNHG